MRGYLAIAACILYVISPLDLLPEAFLGPFGLPDDILAIVLGLKVALSGRQD